jgi:hypothetical protein
MTGRELHKPYHEILKHQYDFRVRYRFLSQEEGGRRKPPFQGYRSDFEYAQKAQEDEGLYMIWPEFEDEASNVIIDNDQMISKSGTARMWIINPEMRSRHQKRIKLGIKGYFREGARRVAECEVIEIGSLLSNPTEEKK